MPTPVPITFKCPPELLQAIQSEVKATGRRAQAVVIERLAASFGVQVTYQPPGRRWAKKAVVKKTPKKR